jgi:hypothetical protein
LTLRGCCIYHHCQILKMSVIIVQVGQCGNQVGGALWEALAAATNHGSVPSPFFCRDGTARCVLVDSEPKVVMGLHQSAPKRFHEGALVCGQCGRGNHWALGYFGVGNGSRRDPSLAKEKAFFMRKDQRQDDAVLLQHALYALHKEAGRVDQGQLEAIVVIHGLAGGTGSGFTSRLVEKIRMHFTEPESDAARRAAEDAEEEDGLYGALSERRRASYVVSVSVAPQLQGENALQGLNTALTLRSLIRSTDAIIILRNDDVIQPSPHSLVATCNTFTEANATFASWLLPVFHYGIGSRIIGELIEKVAPDPNFKFLSIIPLPQRNYTRYRRCAVLSREYRCGLGRGVEAIDAAQVAELHATSSATMLDLTHSSVELGRPPKGAAAFLASAIGGSSRRSSGGSASSSHAAGVPQAVLVLNQTEELNRSLLFPLLRDAALKIDANAFVSEFLALGMRTEDMRSAYREVARVLLYNGI